MRGWLRLAWDAGVLVLGMVRATARDRCVYYYLGRSRFSFWVGALPVPLQAGMWWTGQTCQLEGLTLTARGLVLGVCVEVLQGKV